MFQLTVTDTDRYQSLAVAAAAGHPVRARHARPRSTTGRVGSWSRTCPSSWSGCVQARSRSRCATRSWTGLRSSWTSQRPTSIEDIDRSVGSPYDPIIVAEEVPTRVARVIAEEHLGLPGVTVDVIARRHYLYGPLVAHILGWTGHVSADEYRAASRRRLPAGRHHRQAGSRGHVRARAAWPVRRPGGPAGRNRARRERAAHAQGTGGGRLAGADHRPRHPARGREGAQVGHERCRAQAGRVHRHEPPERRDPGHGLAADLRRQRLRRRHHRQRSTAGSCAIPASRCSTWPSASSCRPARRTSW